MPTITDAPLLFTEIDAEDFLDCEPAVAHDPNYHDFEGKIIVVNDFEVVKVLPDHRFLVAKKWG